MLEEKHSMHEDIHVTLDSITPSTQRSKLQQSEHTWRTSGLLLTEGRRRQVVQQWLCIVSWWVCMPPGVWR